MKVWLCSNSYSGEFLIATTRDQLLEEMFARDWIKETDCVILDEYASDNAWFVQTFKELFGDEWQAIIRSWDDDKIAENYEYDLLIMEMDVIGT